MTGSIANDLRTEVARILERYTGKAYDAIAPMRVSHVKAMGAYIEAAEDRASRCTCQDVPGFEIDTKRTDAKPYEIMAEASIDRMQARGML